MIGSVLIIYCMAFGAMVIAVVFLYQVSSIRGAAEERAGELDWIFALLKRAAEQIQSDDEDSILAGLQTIAQYKSPDTRAKLFGRIEELSHKRELPNVCRQAEWTKEAIIRQAIFMKGKKRRQIPDDEQTNGG